MTDQPRIEIRFVGNMFRVHVVAPTGRGDMACPVVWQGTSYDEAILASGRFACTTGLPVADLVVT